MTRPQVKADGRRFAPRRTEGAQLALWPVGELAGRLLIGWHPAAWWMTWPLVFMERGPAEWEHSDVAYQAATWGETGLLRAHVALYTA